MNRTPPVAIHLLTRWGRRLAFYQFQSLILVESDGNSRWDAEDVTFHAVEGRPRKAVIVDATGRTLGKVQLPKSRRLRRTEYSIMWPADGMPI